MIRDQFNELNIEAGYTIGPAVNSSIVDERNEGNYNQDMSTSPRAVNACFTGSKKQLPHLSLILQQKIIHDYPELEGVSVTLDRESNRVCYTLTGGEKMNNLQFARLVAKANSLGLFFLGSSEDTWQGSKAFQADQFLGISYSTLVEGLKEQFDPLGTLHRDLH